MSQPAGVSCKEDSGVAAAYLAWQGSAVHMYSMFNPAATRAHAHGAATVRCCSRQGTQCYSLQEDSRVCCCAHLACSWLFSCCRVLACRRCKLSFFCRRWIVALSMRRLLPSFRSSLCCSSSCCCQHTQRCSSAIVSMTGSSNKLTLNLQICLRHVLLGQR